MAGDGGAGSDDVVRLEVALERIARRRHPAVRSGEGVEITAPAATDAAPLARKLDGLIAELRSVLGRNSAD